jgi:single-stranded-DNA-specific exonuclease
MTRQAHWLIPELNAQDVSRLAASLRLHQPAARALVARGYTDPDLARHFLESPLEETHDPYLLKDMPAAVARLRRAIEQQERILLYGDYDADGATAVVILKKAIELAGGHADHHIPHRLRDGYGIRADVIEQAAVAGVTLLISLDTGIRAAEAVRHAREAGVDVIITDHHLPEAELPAAVAILNPNQPDCPYPNKNLCGAGVAFKLVQALFGTLGWPEQKVVRMLKSFLKLVAIGTVADVVPLTGENRAFVKHGLEGLQELRNPGLRALFNVAGFNQGDTPTAGQIAFRIAPRLNAAGRMADASEVIELLLTDDQERADQIANQLHTFNQERQHAEGEIIQGILDECQRTPVTDDMAALVFAGQGWHRGVVGIAASRLVERFHRPAIVLGIDPEEGLAQGSGRSIPPFHLLQALESMPDLFVRFGGHRQAVGLSLPIARVDEFRERLNACAAAQLGPEDFRPHLEIDAPIEFGEATDESIAEVMRLAPFGSGNPAPLFAAFRAEVADDPVVWKQRHVRVRLRQNGHSLTCKAWNFVERLEELTPGSLVDVALQFEADYWALSRGRAGWSATLRDVRPAGADGMKAVAKEPAATRMGRAESGETISASHPDGSDTLTR